jgi:tetratricopeptide (TPR) repeat protein
MRKAAIILCIFFTIVSNCYSGETPRIFLDGIQAYKDGQFDKAIEYFERIIRSGVNNPKLFYNLGNAYLRNNDLGHALLWYERAMKLIPDDPDLKFNYGYAMSLTKDEKEDKDFPVFRILFFWKYLLSQTLTQQIALVLNFLFWLTLIVRMLLKKKAVNPFAYTLLIMGLIFTLTAFYNEYEMMYLKHAIILPEKVSVRSGFAEDSTELFVLHAGTKVYIGKEQGEFFRIQYSEGKIGWIKRSDAGII